ncbi:hypothetical protein QBC40DRAFT_313879 [Triangularia verruculosa]|uniref:Uncharacterized protein n=1 Tax=Triangularia verruculosa TaxID=2587418 RepID=A0AAN6X9C4_9PEZI|nr:hypothetical protein QBC40DRAFT_313879 [Triangularia verruculosa]
MQLFDFHHKIHLLNLDNKWPLPEPVMPTNSGPSSSSNPPPATLTPFSQPQRSSKSAARGLESKSRAAVPAQPQSAAFNDDDSLQTLSPNLACLTLFTLPQDQSIALGLINFPSTAVATINKLANASFVLNGRTSYIKQESKTVAWLVVGLGFRATVFSTSRFAEFTRQWVVFLCGAFKELWYHGWRYAATVSNPLEPPVVGRHILANRQDIYVQNFVFRFDGPREPERFDWVGLSLHKLGEVLVVEGLPARLHKKLARAFFPMGLGKKHWGKKSKGVDYKRLSFAERQYMGPKGAEDETVVRLLGVVEGDEGWELYASLATWPSLMLFRKAREPGWAVPPRSVGSEEGVVAADT